MWIDLAVTLFGVIEGRLELELSELEVRLELALCLKKVRLESGSC